MLWSEEQRMMNAVEHNLLNSGTSQSSGWDVSSQK